MLGARLGFVFKRLTKSVKVVYDVEVQNDNRLSV